MNSITNDIASMTKLVSLRIDEEALKALNEHMKGFRLWKRHGVLVSLLENLLLNADTKTIGTIVRHNRYSSMKLNITATDESTIE